MNAQHTVTLRACLVENICDAAQRKGLDLHALFVMVRMLDNVLKHKPNIPPSQRERLGSAIVQAALMLQRNQKMRLIIWKLLGRSFATRTALESLQYTGGKWPKSSPAHSLNVLTEASSDQKDRIFPSVTALGQYFLHISLLDKHLASQESDLLSAAAYYLAHYIRGTIIKVEFSEQYSQQINKLAEKIRLFVVNKIESTSTVQLYWDGKHSNVVKYIQDALRGTNNSTSKAAVIF